VVSFHSKCWGACFAGKVVHSMVAHLDAITSLALDPSGLYLLSGSKCTEIFMNYSIIKLVMFATCISRMIEV
jgi:hypothetical protein